VKDSSRGDRPCSIRDLGLLSERIECALKNLNVQSESVFRSKGKTTMPLWGEGEQEFEPPAC